MFIYVTWTLNFVMSRWCILCLSWLWFVILYLLFSPFFLPYTWDDPLWRGFVLPLLLMSYHIANLITVSHFHFLLSAFPNFLNLQRGFTIHNDSTIHTMLKLLNHKNTDNFSLNIEPFQSKSMVVVSNCYQPAWILMQ